MLESVLRTAKAIARIDCFHSLAVAARRFGYVRPIVDQSGSFANHRRAPSGDRSGESSGKICP